MARNAASCCVGAGAALASFACPLAPSNSLFSSAAASGLGRVAPTRAAHWGGPESLAHLWGGKGQSQPPRVFCRVPTCPCSDAARARGWATVAPCWLLATGCANCLAPFPQPHSLSCLRSQCLPNPRGPPTLQARGSGSRSGRCHPNGHRRLATPTYPFQPSKLPRLPPCGMSL